MKNLVNLVILLGLIFNFEIGLCAEKTDYQKKLDELKNKYKKNEQSKENKEELKTPSEKIKESINETTSEVGNFFYGYDKIKWGSSTIEVQAAYPNIKLDNDWTSEEGINGFVCYSEYFPTESLVRKKYFFFANNQLYKVSIDFNEYMIDNRGHLSAAFVKKINTDVFNLMWKKIEEQYGKLNITKDFFKRDMLGELMHCEMYSKELFNGKMHVDVRQILNQGKNSPNSIELFEINLWLNDIENKRSIQKAKNNIKKQNIDLNF